MKAEEQKMSVNRFFKTEYYKLLNFVRKNIEEQFFDASPEDIVQDVALNILNKLDVDSQIENFAGYIYRSLKNKIIDTNRKEKSNISLELYDNSLIKSIPDETYADNDNAEDAEISYEMLYEGISMLKPDEQAIIMLTEFEGRTFAELSERWDIPMGTLLSRKHRALSKLSKILTTKENKQTIKTNNNGNERKLLRKKVMSV